MPWIALGVVLQGVYLLTSIGLNITKRTEFYPMATGLAAVTSVGANLALVPGYGVTGRPSPTRCPTPCWRRRRRSSPHRVYPVGYEWGRMARLAAAGFAGYATAVLLVPITWPAVPALLARVARGRLGLRRVARADGISDRVRAPPSRCSSGHWPRKSADRPRTAGGG